VSGGRCGVETTGLMEKKDRSGITDRNPGFEVAKLNHFRGDYSKEGKRDITGLEQFRLGGN